MAKVEDLVKDMRANPLSIRFSDAVKVATHYFGQPRQNGTSHCVWKMSWPGDPRVNLQKGKDGNAKGYQIRQLLSAIEKAEQLTPK
jgi:hypothetical protein